MITDEEQELRVIALFAAAIGQGLYRSSHNGTTKGSFRKEVLLDAEEYKRYLAGEGDDV